MGPRIYFRLQNVTFPILIEYFKFKFIGSRLLTGSSCLQLWSNTNFENPSEDENREKTDAQEWRSIWQCK